MNLVQIITAICERAGVPAALIDVTLLPDVSPDGLIVTNQYAAAEALRSLGQVYLFDMVPVNGKIWFVPRGGNSVATITEEEVVDDGDTVLQIQRDDQLQIPRMLHLNYYDTANGGLNAGKQTSERLGVRRATGERSIQTPVVMTADLALQTADIQHKVLIEETGSGLKLSLPDSYLKLVPTNPIIFQRQGSADRLRIIEATVLDGYQEYECVRDRQSAYTSVLEGIPLPAPTAPPSGVVGPTPLEILDIPVLLDTDDVLGLGYYVALGATTDAWGGAAVEVSRDGGVTYPETYSIAVSTAIGALASDLGDHDQPYPDDLNTCQVRVYTKSDLFDTTLTGMMNRINLSCIENELVNFAEVTELGDGVWELSYWLRGRKGTEPEAHALGSRFVVLDRTALTFIPAKLEDIGTTITVRATSFGLPIDSGVTASITYAGNVQRERAVAYLEAHKSGSNLVINWQGVGRLGSGVAAYHGIKFAGYRVTISGGLGPPVEVETLSEQYVVDANSLGLNSPLTITVVQLNELTGAGPPTSITIPVPDLAPIVYPINQYEVEFTGTPAGDELFFANIVLVPLSGPVVEQLVSGIGPSGATTAADYADDLAAQADAAFSAVVTVTQPSPTVVRFQVAQGRGMIVTVVPVHPYGALQTLREPLPAQASVQQVVGLELYYTVAGFVNPAPSTDNRYRQGGGAIANFTIYGTTFETNEAVNYGLSRSALWTVADGISDQKIVSLQGAVPPLQAPEYAPYFANVAVTSFPDGRVGVGVWVKDGFRIFPSKYSAGTGSHPSAYTPAFEEITAGVPGYPSGAKKMVAIYFSPQRNAGPTPALFLTGQDVVIELDGTPFSHTLTSDEATAMNFTGAADPTTVGFINGVYDDLKSSIQGGGNFTVFNEVYGNGLYRNWRVERNVANTDFTAAAYVSGFDLLVSIDTTTI